jgi:hypothetical protein
LTAGTTASAVVGYQQVLVGTQQVVVGQEQYVAGTQDVQVGIKQVVVGSEEVLIGTEQIQVGKEKVKVGTEIVKSDAAPAQANVTAAAPANERDVAAAAKIRTEVGNLVATSNALATASNVTASRQAAPGAEEVRAFANEVSAALTSTNFTQLNASANASQLDRAIGRIDDLLARAKSFDKPAARAVAGLATKHQVRAAANALLIQSELQNAHRPASPFTAAADAARPVAGAARR